MRLNENGERKPVEIDLRKAFPLEGQKQGPHVTETFEAMLVASPVFSARCEDGLKLLAYRNITILNYWLPMQAKEQLLIAALGGFKQGIVKAGKDCEVAMETGSLVEKLGHPLFPSIRCEAMLFDWMALHCIPKPRPLSEQQWKNLLFLAHGDALIRKNLNEEATEYLEYCNHPVMHPVAMKQAQKLVTLDALRDAKGKIDKK